MKLSQILQRLTCTTQGADPTAIDITSVEQDSRRVGPGALFVAVRGTVVDGHTFIPQAIAQGAAAIVCDRQWAESHADEAASAPALVVVDDCNLALALVASAWYGYPSEQLTLVGVTGTNGKTTIATLLYRLFTQLGFACGLLSTVCNYVQGRAIEATHTTPDPLELNALLAQMVAEGCTFAFMEVSSHAADQKRIGGLDFDGGIFTNLTRDHMDYHKTVENYLHAKQSFFDGLKKSAFALTNADDRNGQVMVQNTRARRRTYSVRSGADYTARIGEESLEGMELTMASPRAGLAPTEVQTHFVGRFNASNLAAVYGAALELTASAREAGHNLGIEPSDVVVAMSGLHPVNGRFEAIRSPRGVAAIIDYAHTPDALVNVLDTLHEIIDGRRQGHIITVVGCGGNRDKGKRPIMAQEAARRSDRLVLTSDNPRNEEPEAILADMLAGLEGQPDLMGRTITIADRREAIRTAIMLAQPGDVVLVAGKGHEDYQIIQGVKHHFDDHEVVRQAMGLADPATPAC